MPLGTKELVTLQRSSHSVLAGFIAGKLRLSAHNFAHAAESDGAFALLCREGYDILNRFSYNELRRGTE